MIYVYVTCKRGFLLAPFFVYCCIVLASDTPIFRTSETYYGVSGYRYTIAHSEHTIGMLSCLKIPCLQWYILYDFFIQPDYRRQGYGHMLLAHVIAEVQSYGATYVFIQPGPFELQNGVYVTLRGPERSRKLAQLIRLYTSYGFVPVVKGYGILLWPLLYAAYALCRIYEDPQYLMVLKRGSANKL